jgi:hypothetical protein
MDFGRISGLRTNVEKSTMMRIGNQTEPMDPRILDLGFVMVENMKILGFEVDNRAERLGENFDKVIRKMRQIVGNWSRFRLTLPGRIAIAKSLLLSQVTFPGTILNPTQLQITEMSEIIENFVTVNIVIAKERIYAPVKKGGLGLINIESFLAAQKCAWIRRCFSKINDAWRWEFLKLANFSLSTVRLEFFNKNRNPMLWNIANAVCLFQNEYWKRDENYLEAPIFNNKMFLCEPPRPRAAVPDCMKWTRIRRETRNDFAYRILELKIKDIIVDGIVIDYNMFCRRTGIPFTPNEYLYIAGGARYARERYGNKPDSNGTSESITERIYSKKGGSKKFQRYFDYGKNKKPVTELNTVKKFFELVELPVPDGDSCGVVNSIWNLHTLPNGIRFFAFQFYNNSLATGTRLAARYRADPAVQISDLCTFCRAANRPNPAREDFRHLFYDCPELNGLYARYLERYGSMNMNNVEKRNFLFTGTKDGSWNVEQFIVAVHNIIFYYGIWLAKLSRKIPSFVTIENNMLTIFDNTVSLSIYLTELSTNGNSSICRLWRHRNGRG